MKKKSWKQTFFWIIIFFLLTAFLTKKLFFFDKGILENISANVTYPMIWACNKITSPLFSTSLKIKSQQKLLKKIEKLKSKNEILSQENIKLKSCISFDKDNKELLDFKKRYNLDSSIFAEIIGKNFSNSEHYVLINRGEIHGIKKNMVAIHKLQIIGRVIEVFRWYSKILLITDKKCKVAAKTNMTNATGICIGKNRLKNLKLSFVSSLSKIIEKDYILSSGEGLIFPKGFCLGQISKYTKNGIYYEIEVKPLIKNLSLITNCLIIDKEKLNDVHPL